MKLSVMSFRGQAAIDGLADELLAALPEQRSWRRCDLFRLEPYELVGLRAGLSAQARLTEADRVLAADLAVTREELDRWMRLAALDCVHGNVDGCGAREQSERLQARVSELEAERRQLRSAIRGHAEDIAEMLRVAELRGVEVRAVAG